MYRNCVTFIFSWDLLNRELGTSNATGQRILIEQIRIYLTCEHQNLQICMSL